MEKIKLKSNYHGCIHELYSLEPLQDNGQNEKVYKFISKYDVEIIRDKEKTPIGISFRWGPVLYVGEINPDINMPLKEIVPTFDSEGEFIYLALIFDNK